MSSVIAHEEKDSGKAVKPFSSIPWFHPPGEGREGCNPLYFENPTTCFIEPYRKLGPLFRCKLWGLERVAMGGVEANRFTWGDKDLWNYYKSNRIFREQFSNRYLNQLRGEAYTKKRRRINQGFKPSLLLAHAPGMSRVISEELQRLPEEGTDLRPLCMRLMICMTSRVLLQQDLPPGMDATMALSNKEMLRSTSLGRLRWLWYFYPPKRWRRRKIFNYLNRILDEREKNPLSSDDILSLILKAHPPSEPPLPRFELVHDLSQLFMGGSTTTAGLISWSLLYAFQDESWLEEIREELSNWNPEKFRMEDFPKTRATCLEIERLKPSVPIFNRIAAKDFIFRGYRVPRETPVLHLHTLCHFLEEIYEDPLQFKPQRFLENPNLPARDMHGTYGGGEHRCVGQNLARVASFIALAVIASRFQMEFLDGPPSMKDCFKVGPAPVEKHIRVRFLPRN